MSDQLKRSVFLGIPVLSVAIAFFGFLTRSFESSIVHKTVSQPPEYLNAQPRTDLDSRHGIYSSKPLPQISWAVDIGYNHDLTYQLVSASETTFSLARDETSSCYNPANVFQKEWVTYTTSSELTLIGLSGKPFCPAMSRSFIAYRKIKPPLQANGERWVRKQTNFALAGSSGSRARKSIIENQRIWFMYLWASITLLLICRPRLRFFYILKRLIWLEMSGWELTDITNPSVAVLRGPETVKKKIFWTCVSRPPRCHCFPLLTSLLALWSNHRRRVP